MSSSSSPRDKEYEVIYWKDLQPSHGKEGGRLIVMKSLGAGETLRCVVTKKTIYFIGKTHNPISLFDHKTKRIENAKSRLEDVLKIKIHE